MCSFFSGIMHTILLLMALFSLLYRTCCFNDNCAIVVLQIGFFSLLLLFCYSGTFYDYFVLYFFKMRETRTPAPKAFRARLDATRDGLPASVLDPLLSLLCDLQQLEERVISTLKYFGWTGNFPGRHENGGERPPLSTDLVCAGPPVEEVQESCQEDILSVIKWLSALSSPIPTSSADEAEVLSRILSQPGEMPSTDCVLLRESSSAPTDAGEDGNRKRARDDTLGTAELENAAYLGEFSRHQLTDMLSTWEQYESRLDAVTRDVGHLIHSICTNKLQDSLSSHAKWIEIGKEDKNQLFCSPSVKDLRRNYDEMILYHDTMATCQSAVHKVYKDLVASTEQYLTECETVLQIESDYWDNVALVEREWAMLKQLKIRLSRVVKTVKLSVVQ
ncbi:hypothetical protein AGDE_13533 [Angomonas deanei]|uniref:Uncharacterized protein n=1 Tax=Angomonas deanei TaxID=59799 RepID=A0A7G2CGW0_9TRYP|nr:hypothetical protein AGDE_13533 [Angomonas deanei]CAD2217432.1 hypothetical protein, conserved [Angomonas deanei]|eukprot:EPY22155.1 hypothetical protein AGDE_13533 [Angomonas deanei]